MLAQYIGDPLYIYVGAQAVYVNTDTGYVGRANRNGSDLKPLARPDFASSAFVTTLVAEDGDRVFLTRNNGSATQLSYCLVTGCDSTATPIGGPWTQHFTVDQTNHKVFWVEYSPSRLVSASTVGTVSGTDLPGGTLEAGTGGSRLFYSRGGIYFAEGTGVSRIPASGGSIASVTGGTSTIAILGTNSTSLFVADNGSISSVPLPSGDGKGPKPLLAGALEQGANIHFAADEISIYWVTGGQARTCEISNCPGTQKPLPKRVNDYVVDVGIDGAAIYSVTDSGDANTPHIATAWKTAK